MTPRACHVQYRGQMTANALTSVQVLSMIEKIESDGTLDNAQRSHARRLRATVADPALVLSRLQKQARAYLPRIARHVPTAALCRAVTAESFRMHLAKPEVREAFTTSADFLVYVHSFEDKSSALLEMLTPDIELFSWERSWLADSRKLRGLNGQELSLALELEKEPPFVLFNFEVEQLRSSGVLIRTPCSLDSVLGPNPQWRPGGPMSGIDEYVDGDVPFEALTNLEWRE